MVRFVVAAKKVGTFVRKLATKKEEGAALVEYGLLVGLIAVICVSAITVLGQDVSSLFSRIASKLSGI